MELTGDKQNGAPKVRTTFDIRVENLLGLGIREAIGRRLL